MKIIIITQKLTFYFLLSLKRIFFLCRKKNKVKTNDANFKMIVTLRPKACFFRII